MAVLSETRVSVVKFLSKEHKAIYEMFFLICNGAFLLKRRLVHRRNVKPKVTQRGASVSTPQSGNKPQENMIRGSNNHVINVNYYGSDYASAHSSATTQMDPNAFTKPVADVLSGPALKSPTVEECGYSDRIIQLTMGNSTITTQEAANAVVGYGVWPEPAPGMGEAVDRSSEPGPSVDRFYTLDSVNWTASFKGRCYRYPLCLSDYGMFGQNIRFHYLMRGGLIAHVQINATKFHQGCVLVVAIPECQFTDSSITGLDAEYDITDHWLEQYPIYQLTLFPHQFINLRTNNSATLILPYVNSSPMENAASHNYWTLAIVQVSGLTYSTGASTVVPITLSIAPVATQYNGLRAAVATAQGVIVANAPGSGQFITTIHNSGFPVYPFFEPTTPHDIPGEVVNLLQTSRIDTLVNWGTGQAPEVTKTISVNQAGGTQIFVWRMDLDETWAMTTYLARLSKFFVNYRGSIKLTFTFAGTAMQTAKILLAYTPPGNAAPTTRREAMLGTHVVWDIGLQSSATLVIPWISQSQFRYTSTTDKLSFSGYVSGWFQTSLVTPPGGTTSGKLYAMLSATDDFQFRIPTDNAFYQGLSDDVGRTLDSVEKVTEGLINMKPSENKAEAATTGESAALTATETGATGGAEATHLMETRKTVVGFSGLETDIDNFLSKHALIKKSRATYGLNVDGTKYGQALKVPITVETLQSTLALQTKYEMFTYYRFNMELTVLVMVHQGAGDVGLQQGEVTQSFNAKFQLLYCPPGLEGPPLAVGDIWNDDARWCMPTTPSVYFSSNDPPATLTIPFIGVCSTYTTFYDGYSNFDDATAEYGQFPGNGLGDIYIRPLYHPRAWQDGLLSVEYMVFARPTHIRAWIPRPILQRDVPQTQREVVHNVGPRKNHKHRAGKSHKKSYPKWCRKVAEKLPKAYDSEFQGVHLIPMDEEHAIMPYHWWKSDKILHDGLPHVAHDPLHDLVLVKFKSNYVPKLCDCTEGIATVNWALFYQSIAYQKTGWKAQEEIGSESVGDHWQEDLISAPGEIPSGWCGSPLFCKHGICGVATAASSKTSYFTHLASATVCWDYMPVEEQGPTSWFGGLAEQLGASFGNGFSTTVKNKIADVVKGVKDPTNELIKKIISWLVKAVTASVLIARSEKPLEAAACVATLLGVDMLMGTPFDWLKDKITSLLGLAEEQGPMGNFGEWVKEFNACATAAKGLEWVGEKILKFVEWIKNLIKKEEPTRKIFMEQLSHFPALMETIDKIRANRGSYKDEDVEKVAKNMECLKRGADLHGVERNFMTSQIVKYHGYVQQLVKTSTTTRVEPVAVCIHGSPGTGKSLATTLLAKLLCTYVGGKPYSLPPDPKHFDGYCGQKVVLMDDLNQNPDGEDMKLFCQMVSSTEFIPPMADLSDKGSPFKAKFVLASTNVLVLAPPTVMEPAAIHRRFFRDLDIIIEKDYKVNGKLDATAALTKCAHDACIFTKCCPLICGLAAKFKDRNTNKTYTLDEIAGQLLMEMDRRENTGDLIEALFQGPCPTQMCEDDTGHHKEDKKDEVVWLTSDWDLQSCTLLTLDEQRQKKIPCERPAPQEVVDLLKAVPHPEIIQYCEDQGWILPQPFKYNLVREKVNDTLATISAVLGILASVATLAGFIYVMYSIFADRQGPYAGNQPKQISKPVVRVQVQGPNVQYAQSLIKKSLFEVQCTNGPFTGLGLYGQWILLPRHAKPGETIILNGDGYTVLKDVVFDSQQGNLELRAIRINRPVNFPDIRQKLPEKFREEPDACLAVNSGQYKGMICPVGKVQQWGALMLGGRPTYRTCMYKYPTKTGQCGGIVCTTGKIISMHVGGDGQRGYGTILIRKYFEDLDGVGEQGHITSVQTTKNQVHMSSRTKLQPSVWHSVVPGTKEPAALRQNDPRLEVNLFEATFSKYENKEEPMEMTNNMREAVNWYISKVKPLLPDNVTDQLTLEEAAYGIENLDGLDLNTSAGFPYNIKGIKKRDILDPITRDVSRLQKCMEVYGVDLPFTTYLKDELRPLEKVRKGKTRLIECSSMNDTIRMKMTYGNLFAFYHSNPGPYTGCAVGCNPDIHWTKFRAEMDGQIVAFDYSNYDASLHVVWFECLKEILKGFGFKELRPIDHIVNSRHIYKGIEYTVEGGMPSGCSGTSIFNSIINNVIIMTCVLDVYKGINLEELRIIAYGDDVICTYPYQLDAKLLAEAGSKYGLKMTPPDKSAEFKPMTWEEVTFLKRKFRPAKHYPFLIHPEFDWQEIMESLRWTRNPAHTQEHVRSLADLVWHSGRTKYNEFCEIVRSTDVGKCCILPPYESMKRMWLDQF